MSSVPTSRADTQIEILARAVAARPDAADVFHEMAEAHWRADDLDGYAAFFRRGYLLRPGTRILQSGVPEAELRQRAQTLIDRGAAYAPVMAALAIAEAGLGNGPAVLSLMDHNRFLRRGTIDPPPGASLQEFNRDLALEIKANLKFHDQPTNRAIRRAWRFGRLDLADTPALRALRDTLHRCSVRYMEEVAAQPPHPFVASRPARFELGGWAVVSGGESYHECHLHPQAWATGVYYVVEPEVARLPGSDRGWLHIGPPSELTAAASAHWPRQSIEPVPGSFVLMPSYFWHKTEAMAVDQERICVAFEIRPPELHRHDDPDDD